MALCYRALGRRGDSERACGEALKRNPKHPIALNLCGYFSHLRGEYRQAARYYSHALEADPKYADAAHNLGIALHFMGQIDDAIVCYQRALALSPDSAQLYYNLGLAQETSGDYAAAIDSQEKALKLNPDHLEAFFRLGYLKRTVCDWDGLDAFVAELERRVEDYVPDKDPVKLSPWAGLTLNVRPEVYRRLAQQYAEVTEGSVSNIRIQEKKDHSHHQGKLRIGYLSPDFGQHAIGMLTRDLFQSHDRESFEVCSYSLRQDTHPNLAHVRDTSDVFRDVSGLSFAETAKQIAADDVHILVDMAGYTRDSRPEILALRPAPLQLSWLGYLDTMAASFIDYIISDSVAAPPGEDELFDEKIIRLPPSFLIGSPLEPAETPSREALGLPAEGVVYSSFNNSYKLDPELFATWMNVLAAVPDSVLWLYPGKSELAIQHLSSFATEAGIDPKRLIFAEGIAIEEHLARQRHADLFLDAFQYGAGATGVAALMAGVPVLTVCGTRMVARMGASMNAAMDMNELTCETLNDYETLAIRIGSDPDYRRAIREKASKARSTSALLDVPRFVGRMEKAYREIWSRYLAGDKPEPVTITD